MFTRVLGAIDMDYLLKYVGKITLSIQQVELVGCLVRIKSIFNK